MKLLKITDREIPELDRHFEDVEKVSVEEVAPEVRDNKPNVNVGRKSIEEFDAVYAEIPQKNAIFGRVLLEMIEEKGIRVNYPSTAFFIMSKKNYLYHVLHEKEIPAPKTSVIADEKAARNMEKHLKGPLIARKFDGLIETESTKIDTVDEIHEFSDGVEYGDNIIIFNELRRGDKYRCLVVEDTIISLEDNSDGWRVKEENLNYSSLSSDLKETVKRAAKVIGTKTAEVILRGGKVVDANPNPDLELYTKISGKDAHNAVADALKE